MGNSARISQADSCRHGLSEVARGRFRATGGALGLGDMEQKTAGAPQPEDDDKPDLRACQGDQAESGRHRESSEIGLVPPIGETKPGG